MTAWATAATTTIVNTTSPIDRRAIGATFARRSRNGVVNAAPKSSGGRNTSSTRSGSRAMVGKPGTKASPRPPITNRVGKGTPMRWAISYRIAMITSIATMAISTSTVVGSQLSGGGGAAQA